MLSGVRSAYFYSSVFSFGKYGFRGAFEPIRISEHPKTSNELYVAVSLPTLGQSEHRN
jgi:hypothetical protein